MGLACLPFEPFQTHRLTDFNKFSTKIYGSKCMCQLLVQFICLTKHCIDIYNSLLFNRFQKTLTGWKRWAIDSLKRFQKDQGTGPVGRASGRYALMAAWSLRDNQSNNNLRGADLVIFSIHLANNYSCIF